METKENNKYKPFNLEEAKAGRPVCTRNGQEVRIICFNKDRFAPRCTNYNGFWWDVDDKTSRIEVLSILIDIYERKLNDENLYYIG